MDPPLDLQFFQSFCKVLCNYSKNFINNGYNSNFLVKVCLLFYFSVRVKIFFQLFNIFQFNFAICYLKYFIFFISILLTQSSDFFYLSTLFPVCIAICNLIYLYSFLFILLWQSPDILQLSTLFVSCVFLTSSPKARYFFSFQSFFWFTSSSANISLFTMIRFYVIVWQWRWLTKNSLLHYFSLKQLLVWVFIIDLQS